MSKKMWNRIFKTKSNNKTTGISKAPPTIHSAVENRLSYYEEFHNCCQQQSPIKAKASHKQLPLDTPAKTPSKFSKVVNTFTLKRNSKENQSNQLNTTTTTTTADKTASTNYQNEINNTTEENVGGPIMDKIGTPTATQPDNTIEASEEPVSLELTPCPICSRTFVPKTLEKHVRICEKMTVRKRKIFDSSRQRREGTELAAYPLPKNFGLPPVKSERGLSPKPMQAPPPILSPKKPPEEGVKPLVSVKSGTPVAVKKLTNPSPTSASLLNTPTVHSISAPKERTRAAVLPKRIQPPPAETCPYCERCFGVKAYDRHVEWCKEKALIASIKQNTTNTQVAAKERLEARTKYRAPCLKTKRSVNRDKYSFPNDEIASMQTSIEERQPKSSIMTSSMTSSLMSDGGLSDNYDPFLSAKRQLEELCSPSSPTEVTFTPSNLTGSPKTPKLPTTKPSTPTISNKMTTSLTSTSSLTNPRRALTATKSNFRRTSSLRAPRRSPLPIPTRPTFFPSTQKQRPTIQRGLSDEGPISTNFLKPEEYDEMPVRAVCVNDFAISNTPRVVRRDSNAAANRKNLRLHMPGTGQSSKDGSPTPPIGTANINLLKTDSLAVFLKYENEAKTVENPVINSKELKDKSNTLSKQNSAKSIILTDEQEPLTRPSDTPTRVEHFNLGSGNMNGVKLEPIVRPMSAKQSVSPMVVKRSLPIVTSPVVTKPINLNLLFDTRDRLPGGENDYIDPKLINVCDNLPMNYSNDLPLSSNSSSSGGDRNDSQTEKLDHPDNGVHLSSSSNSSPSPITFKRASSPAPQVKAIPAPDSNRNSGGDSRVLLKRKIRLGRNQFLYDASPENEAHDNDADDEGNNPSSCESDRRKLHQHIPLIPQTSTNIPPFSPSTFDEFDFEEFLSSFDNDDEQFPSLFKDCREFLMNRTTLNKRSNTENIPSYRSTNEVLSNSARKYEQDVEQNLNSDENKKRGEIFISIETDQNDNDPHPKNDPLVTANPTAQIEEVDANDNKFRKIEDDDDADEDRRGGGQVDGDEDDDHLRMRRINLLNDFPNVRLNNAKNLIQQMHEDFQDLHAVVAANVEDEINGNTVRQMTGSSLYPVDSDEISSIECYPVRRGGSGIVGGSNVVQSKHNADSAYGSLSRQSPTAEMNSHRSHISNRTRTPATPQESSQQSPFLYPSTQYKYGNVNKNEIQKYRCRNFSIGSSSSSSDNSLPPISANKNITSAHQEHQSQSNEFKRPFYRNQLSSSSLENKIIHNSSSQITGTTSNNSSTSNLGPPATPTSPSVKISKFCHECGSRFLLDQAKFCMDCGVRRIVLK